MRVSVPLHLERYLGLINKERGCDPDKAFLLLIYEFEAQKLLL
jgi:hypothetical protein